MTFAKEKEKHCRGEHVMRRTRIAIQASTNTERGSAKCKGLKSLN
jgi:hypothetical protein